VTIPIEYTAQEKFLTTLGDDYLGCKTEAPVVEGK
jgi:hypothetical protein